MEILDTHDIDFEACGDLAEIFTKEVFPANLDESFSTMREIGKKGFATLLIKDCRMKNHYGIAELPTTNHQLPNLNYQHSLPITPK